MIRQRYREEFEQLGVFELTKRVNGALYDEDNRTSAGCPSREAPHFYQKTTVPQQNFS